MFLAQALVEHSEALEADLARYYPRDADQLPAFWSGEMSVRRLWVLVSGLPRDSAMARELLGDAAEWSPEMHRLTDIVDVLNGLVYVTVRANGGKAKRPKPVPRPRTPRR